MADGAAIYMVNGGRDPDQGKWLELSVGRIIRHTRWPDYHLYVWNNNFEDQWVADFLARIEHATLLTHNPAEDLAHKHAIPLQRLYDRSRADNPRYIVTMDSDAFPLRDEWLTALIRQLDQGAALAGVWRDELSQGIDPYIHPSCLATTTEFVERYGLRFDDIPKEKGVRFDTLSSFTKVASKYDRPLYKLPRSNTNDLHRIIGGVYGDMIYHHGAGSRRGATFWDEPKNILHNRRNLQNREIATTLVFEHTETYLDWLRGRLVPASAFYLLGMHFSGISALAAGLEACGLTFDTSPHPKQDRSAGQIEKSPATEILEDILVSNQGSWADPPSAVQITTSHQTMVATMVSKNSSREPWGLGDPRLLFTLEPWLAETPAAQLIGTFGHPAIVASAVAQQTNLSLEAGYELWHRYNQKLVRLHKEHQFPLVAFEGGNRDAYLQTLAALALSHGLRPDLVRLKKTGIGRIGTPPNEGVGKVPDQCASTYQYLRENQYRPRFTERSFEAALLNWGALNAEVIHVSFLDRLEFEMYKNARHLPKPIRRIASRIKQRLIKK